MSTFGGTISSSLSSVLGPIGRNRDLVFVLAVISILFIILMPIPTQLMDFCLIVNVTLALLVLLTTIYVRQPLDFSVFPALLLVTTLYRLALNVATTRMILGRAGEAKAGAAGGVIQVFGNFVAGDSALVGFIIFVVLVVIQFVVITKGATRVAEVAARFTLDKMPGQQLSIDADLNAGIIDDVAAKERRERIQQEADFYGAMDGASKFVRGDAIAGIIITLINITGGLILGMTKYDMPFEEAVQTFTILTIGDGLVSQVPALVISIAAGLIVTRTNSESNLGQDLISQVFANPRAIAVTGVFLLLLIPAQLPMWTLILGAGILGAIAYRAHKQGDSVADDEEAAATQAESASPTELALPSVDPLELEVGYALVNLVDPGDDSGLLQRVASIREQIAHELGLVIPAVRIRDNMQLAPEEYCVKLRGESIGRGQVNVDHFLAMDPGLGLDALEGIPTKEPAFGIDAMWISEENKGRAEAMGYTVVDVISVVATHLTETIRDHCAELLTREELSALVERLKVESPAVVNEVIPDLLKLGDVQKVLQNLLREKVSIRDLEGVLECLGDWAAKTKDTEVLTEYVRNTLGRSICRQFADTESKLKVVTLDPRVEEFIQNATEHNERGSFLRLSPEMQGPIVQSVSRAFERLVTQGSAPVLLTSPAVRLQVRRMLENAVPGVAVLSYNEVVRGIAVESVGVARLD